MHGRSLADPEGFWGEAAMAIEWHRRWDSVLDHSSPPFTRWFVGGELNTCHNALDRHVEAGNGDRTALIYDSPLTARIERFDDLPPSDIAPRPAGVLAPPAVANDRASSTVNVGQ